MEFVLAITDPVSLANDREYAWRHAFAYADCAVSTDDAARYANHYAQLIADEDETRYWPGHSEVFCAWRVANGL